MQMKNFCFVLVVLSTATIQGKQQTCCKVCRKGKPCGNTCISKAKSCHVAAGCACSIADDRDGNGHTGGSRGGGTNGAEHHARGRRGHAGIWSAARKILDTYINSLGYGGEFSGESDSDL